MCHFQELQDPSQTSSVPQQSLSVPAYDIAPSFDCSEASFGLHDDGLGVETDL